MIKFPHITSKFLIFAVFSYAFLLWSPVIAHFLPLSVSHFVFIQILILIAFLIVEKRSLKKEIALISLLSLLGSFISSIYWGGEIKIALFSSIFVSSLIMVSILKKKELHSIIDLSTSFIIILLIGAWIAFMYVLSGGHSIFEVIRVDGKPMYLFLTTFSNSWNPYLNSIRSAGIYDEPGAFAFVICTVAALRHISGKDKKTTWVILFLGLVTLSLAYLIYVIFHFLAERKNNKYIFQISVILLIILLLISAFSLIYNNNYLKLSFNVINYVLFSRLVEFSDYENIIESGDRIARFISSFKYINEKTILWGLDKEGFFDAREFREKFPGTTLTVPSSPILRRGLFVSWPYYLLVIFFLIMTIKDKNFVLFGFLLLLFQRPFVMSFGYSILCLLPFCYYIYYRGKYKRKNVKS